jgi:hypothetical protein
LKSCPQCHSQDIRQISSILARLLISVYLFLIFLFFSGSVEYLQAILAFIPIVIPYNIKCFNCNHSYFKVVPQWGIASLLGNNINLIKYLFGILPSMFTITLLITFFPYTGLGRIVALPMIFILNSAVIIVGIIITRKLKYALKSLVWIVLLLFSVYISIYLYPQEDGSSVLNQILEEIKY